MSVSRPRRELAPLSCHTHNMNNMKGGPLNVMEVVRTSKIQHEWRVNSNKIGTRAMFFAVFAIFGQVLRGMLFGSVRLPPVLNKTQQLMHY